MLVLNGVKVCTERNRTGERTEVMPCGVGEASDCLPSAVLRIDAAGQRRSNILTDAVPVAEVTLQMYEPLVNARP
jgi:hypothetical protein